MYSKRTMKIGSKINEYVLTMYYESHLNLLKRHLLCIKNHIREIAMKLPCNCSQVKIKEHYDKYT